jgi:hypothetical protein
MLILGGLQAIMPFVPEAASRSWRSWAISTRCEFFLQSRP